MEMEQKTLYCIILKAKQFKKKKEKKKEKKINYKKLMGRKTDMNLRSIVTFISVSHSRMMCTCIPGSHQNKNYLQLYQYMPVLYYSHVFTGHTMVVPTISSGADEESQVTTQLCLSELITTIPYCGHARSVICILKNTRELFPGNLFAGGRRYAAWRMSIASSRDTKSMDRGEGSPEASLAGERRQALILSDCRLVN